jgi:hypothetical protein
MLPLPVVVQCGQRRLAIIRVVLKFSVINHLDVPTKVLHNLRFTFANRWSGFRFHKGGVFTHLLLH